MLQPQDTNKVAGCLVRDTVPAQTGQTFRQTTSSLFRSSLTPDWESSQNTYWASPAQSSQEKIPSMELAKSRRG